jgi:hypothetical protein
LPINQVTIRAEGTRQTHPHSETNVTGKKRPKDTGAVVLHGHLAATVEVGELLV